MSEPDTTSVRSSIVVEAPIERAFAVFTEGIGTWWPPEHHILEGELAEMVFEPREGGHVYDRAVDGSECRWARVLAYEPPQRVLITWDISLQWRIESDPAKTSEVEVRFFSETSERTAGRARAPEHRPPRRGLGGDAPSRRVARGLGRGAAALRGTLRGGAASGPLLTGRVGVTPPRTVPKGYPLHAR